MFSVLYADKSLKQLEKMDYFQKKLILKWIEKNLVNCKNPRHYGKAIKGDLSQWRYRVGNYRILANIYDKKITILIVAIGHRKSIYK